jgi:hypothetical protein
MGDMNMISRECLDAGCVLAHFEGRTCIPETCQTLKNKKEGVCPSCGEILPAHSMECATAKHFHFWRPVSV